MEEDIDRPSRFRQRLNKRSGPEIQRFGVREKKPREGAEPSPFEITEKFFKESVTSSAPEFHWRQELRGHLEKEGIIKNGLYNHYPVDGLLPSSFSAALRKLLKGDFRDRVKDNPATRMEVAREGEGDKAKAKLVPTFVIDRVRQALYHHGDMTKKELAAYLGLSENRLGKEMAKIPYSERAELIRNKFKWYPSQFGELRTKKT